MKKPCFEMQILKTNGTMKEPKEQTKSIKTRPFKKPRIKLTFKCMEMNNKKIGNLILILETK